MLPLVQITKSDGNTGVVKPSSDGILAIIAPSSSGTANQPSTFSRQDLASAAFGYGLLPECFAYAAGVTKKPAILIKATTSTAASLGTVAHSGAGTSVVTVTGTPNDDYELVLKIALGGTIATGPISLQYSLDGGKTWSGVISLGTAVTYLVPNTGVTFNFAAGTVLAGQTESVAATGPSMTNADLVTALEALRTFGGSWDSILVAGLDATSTEIATLDSWLSAREGEGKYKTAVVNAVPRDALTQTEAQYLTAMTTAFSSVAASLTKGIAVCADAGYVVSPIRGNRAVRPVSLGFAARLMAIDISRDAAFVADGPIAGYQITDDRLNPKFHDEALFPGLDDLRLVTLRSFYGREGAFCNNPNLLSPSGSDYVYFQHVRVMNRACEIAHQLLSARLSQGVRKDVATGYILEEDALDIEGVVNAELDKQLTRAGRVSGALFTLSRTDDLSSNAGATVNGEVQVSALSYLKKFLVNSRFTKTIQVTT